jgi:hypothetical protein
MAEFVVEEVLHNSITHSPSKNVRKETRSEDRASNCTCDLVLDERDTRANAIKIVTPHPSHRREVQPQDV